LSEFCEFSNGLWTGKKPPFQTVGVIRNTNFTKDCQLDDSDIVYLEVEQSQFQKRKLQYGDIILEKSGGGPKQPVGRVVIFDKTEGDFSFSNFTSVIRIKNKKEVDFNFLHRYLFLEYISGATGKMQSHSTGIRNLKFDEYKEIEIPLPPLPEQQRIVSILDKVFAAIARAKANAEQNLKNAKELFESYLQGVFEKKGDGWEDKTLGEIAFVKSGGTPLRHKTEYWNGEIAWYSSGELNDLYTTNPERHINEFAIENSNAKLFPKGSLLIGMYDTAALKMSILDRDGTFNQAIAGVKPNPKIDLIFILHAINAIKPEILNLRRGVRQKNLSLEKIKNIPIPLPSLKEQQTIVRKLDALRAETQKLEAVYQKKIDDLEELKKSILQKAFSGAL
jgi:type I restriction enzyme S subunit